MTEADSVTVFNGRLKTPSCFSSPSQPYSLKFCHLTYYYIVLLVLMFFISFTVYFISILKCIDICYLLNMHVYHSALSYFEEKRYINIYFVVLTPLNIFVQPVLFHSSLNEHTVVLLDIEIHN